MTHRVSVQLRNATSTMQRVKDEINVPIALSAFRDKNATTTTTTSDSPAVGYCGCRN